MIATETPSMPWEVVDLPYGLHGRLLPTKKYPAGNHGDLLSDEEMQIVSYVRHLEKRVADLTAENTEMGLRLFDLTPPAPDEPDENAALAAAVVADFDAGGTPPVKRGPGRPRKAVGS